MQITTPDIGVDKATVAEILVKVGDTIAIDESVVLLESDKASVEVPSTSAGVVKSISVSLGDEVTEGTVLIELEAEGTASAPVEVTKPETPVAPVAAAVVAEEKVAAPAQTGSSIVDVCVPDIGVEKALVGEILVNVGDEIDVDQSIVVVESDKATVEVPSSVSGVVTSIEIHAGDTVKEGVLLIKVKVAGTTQAEAPVATVQVETVQNVAAPVAPVVEAAPAVSGKIEIAVPDLGVDKAVVAEFSESCDTVEADQSIIVVESDKATVEVPSSTAGVIQAIHVELGQSVSQGAALGNN